MVLPVFHVRQRQASGCLLEVIEGGALPITVRLEEAVQLLALHLSEPPVDVVEDTCG